MRLFLTIAAVLAWIFGVMLLLMPRQFYSSAGIDMTPMLGTVAQAHGATLIGLGLINWLGRDVTDRPGLVAILGGNLLVQVLSLAIAIRTIDLGAGSRMAPSIFVHVALGGGFAYFLSRLRKAA